MERVPVDLRGRGPTPVSPIFALLILLLARTAASAAPCPLLSDGRTTGTSGLALAEASFVVAPGSSDVELASWFRGAASAAWVAANSTDPAGQLHVAYVGDDGVPFPAGSDPSATRDVVLPTTDSTVPSSRAALGRGAAPGCADVPVAVDMGRSSATSIGADPSAGDDSMTQGFRDACPLTPDVALALGDRPLRSRSEGFALLASCPSSARSPCVFVVTMRLSPCAAATRVPDGGDASAAAALDAPYDLIVLDGAAPGTDPPASVVTATAWSPSRSPVGADASRCAVVWTLVPVDPAAPPGGADAWGGRRVRGLAPRLVGGEASADEALPLDPSVDCSSFAGGAVEEFDAPSWWPGDGVADDGGEWVGRLARFAVPAGSDVPLGPWSVVVECERSSRPSSAPVDGGPCVGSVAVSVGETAGIVPSVRSSGSGRRSGKGTHPGSSQLPSSPASAPRLSVVRVFVLVVLVAWTVVFVVGDQ